MNVDRACQHLLARSPEPAAGRSGAAAGAGAWCSPSSPWPTACKRAWSIASGTFLTAHNVRTILVQAAPVAVAALGMTVIIIAGGIDLSAGTALALAATVMAWVLREGYSPAVGGGGGHRHRRGCAGWSMDC